MFPVNALVLVARVISTAFAELHDGRTLKRDNRLRNKDEATKRTLGFEGMPYYSQNAVNGNNFGIMSVGYKKGEGALPCLFFMFERLSDLPLFIQNAWIYIA